MYSLFARKAISSSYFFSSSHLQHHHLALLTPLLRLSLSTQSHQQKETPFVAQYLVSSLGFSPDRALKVSSSDNRLTRIHSSSQLDSVVGFLKEIGLSDGKIKSAISFNPILLYHNVDETLKPKAHQLMAAGFTGEILVDLIRYNPFVLQPRTPIAPLQFWRDFIGGNDVFLKLIQCNGLLITRDIDKHATPRLNLLKEYGVSHKGIVYLLTNCSRFWLYSLDKLCKKLKDTDELGFMRGSNMFLHGLRVIVGFSKEMIGKRSQFFKKMYGWSDEEVRLAFVKFPSIIARSEKRIKAIMDFLTKNAGLEPRYIASQAILLLYSLEKTLIPRHHVLSILKAHGLKNYKLLTVSVMSKKKFLEKCIVPHEKDVPGLAQAYAAVLSGKVPH